MVLFIFVFYDSLKSTLTLRLLGHVCIGAQIISDYLVWYNNKMLFGKRAKLSKTIDFCVMMVRYRLDRQRGGPFWHSANVGCSFFRYLNYKQNNNSNHTPPPKKKTIKDSKCFLYSYFWSNPR